MLYIESPRYLVTSLPSLPALRTERLNTRRIHEMFLRYLRIEQLSTSCIERTKMLRLAEIISSHFFDETFSPSFVEADVKAEVRVSNAGKISSFIWANSFNTWTTIQMIPNQTLNHWSGKEEDRWKGPPLIMRILEHGMRSLVHTLVARV